MGGCSPISMDGMWETPKRSIRPLAFAMEHPLCGDSARRRHQGLVSRFISTAPSSTTIQVLRSPRDKAARTPPPARWGRRPGMPGITLWTTHLETASCTRCRRSISTDMTRRDPRFHALECGDRNIDHETRACRERWASSSLMRVYPGQHLGGVAIGVHFFPDLADGSIGQDEEAGARHRHVGFAVHGLLDPDT